MYYIHNLIFANINTPIPTSYNCRGKVQIHKHWLFLVGGILGHFYFLFDFVYFILFPTMNIFLCLKKTGGERRETESASINQKVCQSVFLNNRIIHLGAALGLSPHLIARSRGYGDLNQGGSH